MYENMFNIITTSQYYSRGYTSVSVVENKKRQKKKKRKKKKKEGRIR